MSVRCANNYRYLKHSGKSGLLVDKEKYTLNCWFVTEKTHEVFTHIIYGFLKYFLF